jgi:hypothetical protein
MKLKNALLPLLLAVPACGGTAPAMDDDDVVEPPDVDAMIAVDPDADPDVPPEPDAGVEPDAEPQPEPVTVRVLSSGDGIAGVHVVFSDASGEVIAHVETGDDGGASEVVPPGGAVSIVRIGDGNSKTVTWLAVEAGDLLVYDIPSAPSGDLGELTVNMSPPSGGATAYQVQIGCRSITQATSPIHVDLTSDCVGSDGNVDVFATAWRNGMPVGYRVTEVEVGSSTVNFSFWDTTDNYQLVTLRNATGFAIAGADAGFRADGQRYRVLGRYTEVVGSVGYVYFNLPTVLPEQLEYAAFIKLAEDADAGNVGVIAARYPDLPEEPAHDLATELLPAIAGAWTTNASGRPQVSWSTAESLAGTDGAVMHLQWNQGTRTRDQIVVVPPEATSPLLLPALPDALSDYRTTTSSDFEPPRVMFVEADYLDGYNHLRRFGAPSAELDDWFAIMPSNGGQLTASLAGQIDL